MTYKQFLPKSLFGRVLMILVLPTVLIQLVVAYAFFDRHWDTVTRHISSTMAGEVAFFAQRYKKAATPEEMDDVLSDFVLATGDQVYFDDKNTFGAVQGTDDFPDLQQRLQVVISEPFTVRRVQDTGTIEIRVLLPDRILRVETPVKRLESRTTYIFISWMFVTSVVFLLIAVVFLRNQIRPIRRLAEAADNFGRGLDMPGFRPQGASEVKKAARAFMVMRERIKRQMRTRTDMLAGISHDLRTPLTRMKLELAMLPDNDDMRESIRELGDDVQQMEHMIEEYLNFARGEGREEASRVSMRGLIEDVVSDYQRLGSKVAYQGAADAVLDIRVSAFRRVLHNVVDNALRYGTHCKVLMNLRDKLCDIIIEDDGPGIPPEQYEEVFKPFSRLDPSRNIKTGGVGLGLSIARDIVLAHGGRIALEKAAMGGLRVVISLPL